MQTGKIATSAFLQASCAILICAALRLRRRVSNIFPFATGLYFFPSEEIFDLIQALALSLSSCSLASTTASTASSESRSSSVGVVLTAMT